VGAHLRRLREQKGWTQTDLATKAKVHRVSVARIETQTMLPTLPTLERLAKALGVPVGELFAMKRPATHARVADSLWHWICLGLWDDRGHRESTVQSVRDHPAWKSLEGRFFRTGHAKMRLGEKCKKSQRQAASPSPVLLDLLSELAEAPWGPQELNSLVDAVA